MREIWENLGELGKDLVRSTKEIKEKRETGKIQKKGQRGKGKLGRIPYIVCGGDRGTPDCSRLFVCNL